MSRDPRVRPTRSRRERLVALRAAGGKPALDEWRTERATAAHEGFPRVPVMLSDGARRVMVWAIERHGDAVHVWTDRERSDAGHLVIVNPPTLVRDDAGPIEHKGARYREDAGQALVDIVLDEVGVAATPRRYRPRGGFVPEGTPVVDPPRGTAFRRAGGQP